MTKQVRPFVKIERGQDSLGPDDELLFADYSPAPVPSDTPEAEPLLEPAPKDWSAPAPVVSSESQTVIVPTSQEATVPVPAVKDSGQPKENEGS